MEKIDQYKMFINQGLSQAQIAKELNVSKSTVRYWLKKYKLKTQFKKNKRVIEGFPDKLLCNKCGIVHNKSEFYQNGGSIHSYCKSCFNKLVLDRQRRIKKEAVYYKGGKCVRCGYDEHLAALQFHHIDEKNKKWANFKLRKFDDKFKQELDKCILLCANCHLIEHSKY